eukprot:5360838-Lingulodinium_polyedra.AAC.1
MARDVPSSMARYGMCVMTWYAMARHAKTCQNMPKKPKHGMAHEHGIARHGLCAGFGIGWNGTARLHGIA